MAVVENGNFSAAARQLNLPPSSISRRISGLENRLGVALFKRTTRDVMLTEAGADYAASVAKILEDLRDADLSASRFTRVPEGCLRIECRPGLSAWLLAPLLPQFLAAYPKIEVDLRLTNETLEHLSPGTDVGIRYGLGTPSSLVTRKLVTTRQGTYASPDYIATHGEPGTPDELLQHNCVAFSFDGKAPNWRFRKGDFDRTLTVTGNMRSNDVNAVASATNDGLGISVAHHWVMERAVSEGRAVPILTDYEVTTMDSFDMHVNAIYTPAMKNVRKVSVFVDFMLKAMRSAQNPAQTQRFSDER